MSAWRIQRRSISSAIPKLAGDLNDAQIARRATVTTSRLISAGNFFGMVPSIQRNQFSH
jgi:hypothetical protein